MQLEKYTTRLQLRGYGMSQYQAIVITKKLGVIGKENRAYTYSLTDVIDSIRNYLNRPHIKAKTRQNLETILPVLLNRLGNVVQVPFFPGTDMELSKLTKQLFYTMREADTQQAEVKAIVATLRGREV